MRSLIVACVLLQPLDRVRAPGKFDVFVAEPRRAINCDAVCALPVTYRDEAREPSRDQTQQDPRVRDQKPSPLITMVASTAPAANATMITPSGKRDS